MPGDIPTSLYSLSWLHTGPLFLFADHSPVTRSYFVTQLSACLVCAGHNPQFYKCQSFRTGAATTAASKRFTDLQIQHMGALKIWCISPPHSHPHDAVVNVRRLHVMLTTELQSVQPTIPLPSRLARATPVRPHEPSAGVRCVKPIPRGRH